MTIKTKRYTKLLKKVHYICFLTCCYLIITINQSNTQRSPTLFLTQIYNHRKFWLCPLFSSTNLSISIPLNPSSKPKVSFISLFFTLPFIFYTKEVIFMVFVSFCRMFWTPFWLFDVLVMSFCVIWLYMMKLEI